MKAEILQAKIALLAILFAVKPVGWYIVRAMEGKAPVLGRALAPLERLLLRLTRTPEGPAGDQRWQGYAASVVAFTGVSVLTVYLLARLQAHLPLNPQGLGAVSPDLALNTAISFATNTNWQSYGGETTMSYATQSVALTVQNFASAAVGIAVLAALARGIVARRAERIGNFWRDLVRATLYVLLPLSLVLSLALVSQGVPQTLGGPAAATAVDRAAPPGDQLLPLGPVASQVAIKQLGTNGGGYYNVNSAHPYENPTPLSNLLETVAILLLPAALCWSFGEWVGDRRQGWALLAAMLVLLLVALGGCWWAESAGNPTLAGLGLDGPNTLEGKETRFGVGGSVLWAVFTTAASNGSVNAMHDSFTPLGGLVPMLLMQLGEVVFGGVGSGLYGMVLFVIVAVFVAGLMVGRTPEYLGKKIGPHEMKMASIAILLPSACVLLGTAIAVAFPAAAAAAPNPGPHGFSEILYAFSSASNNNGSAFAGLSANTPFWNIALAVCMFVGRLGVIVPVLAIAGSLARKGHVPESAGTLPTHTPLFVTVLVSVVLIVGVLTFVPALALGPVADQMRLLAP